jgi:hypothetical protein
MSCWVCCGQSSTGAGFLRVLRFPLPIILPTASHSSPSYNIRGWYSRIVADIMYSVSPHCKKRKKVPEILTVISAVHRRRSCYHWQETLCALPSRRSTSANRRLVFRSKRRKTTARPSSRLTKFRGTTIARTAGSSSTTGSTTSQTFCKRSVLTHRLQA